MALAAITTGQVAYNGYVFNRSFMVSDRTTSFELEPVDIPFAAGQSIAQGKPDIGLYTLQGVFGGMGAIVDHNGNQMLTADSVQAELDYMMSFMQSGDAPLQLRADRYVNAQLSQAKISWQTGNGYRFAIVTLDFKAQDPRFYGNSAYSVSVQSNSGSPGTVVSANLLNAGNAQAWPKLTLTFQSSCVNPAYSIYTPTGGYQIYNALTGTFATTDVVVINTDPRNRSVTKNGVQMFSILNISAFINSVPGDTNLLPYVVPYATSGSPAKLNVNCSSGQFTANAIYSDTYL